mmetsp:Transcript_61390/g.190114  ORF Transcript_61390/g.190114 Transcript_61390/m.190114 type:complete len:544 (+) Transcript_61390:6602-8233(+)
MQLQVEVPSAVLHDRGQQRGRGQHTAAPVFLQGGDEELRVQHGLVGDDEGREAQEQRPDDLPDKHHVEALAAVLLPVWQELRLCARADVQEVIAAGDGLWPSRGARSHHEDGEVLHSRPWKLDCEAFQLLRERRGPVALEDEGLATAHLLELGGVLRAAERSDGAALLADILAERRGEVRLNDDEHGGGVPDPEHARHVGRLMGHQQGHNLPSLAVKVVVLELARQELHAMGELPVGQALCLTHQSLSLRLPAADLENHLLHQLIAGLGQREGAGEDAARQRVHGLEEAAPDGGEDLRAAGLDEKVAPGEQLGAHQGLGGLSRPGAEVLRGRHSILPPTERCDAKRQGLAVGLGRVVLVHVQVRAQGRHHRAHQALVGRELGRQEAEGLHGPHQGSIREGVEAAPIGDVAGLALRGGPTVAAGEEVHRPRAAGLELRVQAASGLVGDERTKRVAKEGVGHVIYQAGGDEGLTDRCHELPPVRQERVANTALTARRGDSHDLDLVGLQEVRPGGKGSRAAATVGKADEPGLGVLTRLRHKEEIR